MPIVQRSSLIISFLTLLALAACSSTNPQIKDQSPTVAGTMTESAEDSESMEAASATTGPSVDLGGNPLPALELSEAEWRKRLSTDEFYILREQGTERAFTSELNDVKDPGTFVCAGCQAPLFSSASKFDSRTGWPSFYEPVAGPNVAERADNTYGMQRVEVECNRCGGHLGHVFNDGPAPTGLRYCINGDALKFIGTP